MADVHLRLTRDEAALLARLLERQRVADLPLDQGQVAYDVMGRLRRLLQPARAQVRRADPPRRTVEAGHHPLY